MVDYAALETIVNELLEIYDTDIPPIPVETMLQKPKEGMWEEVDITQLSGSFLKFDDTYAPRMSMARLLARHISFSEWGAKRGLDALHEDNEGLYAFARMLVIPRIMLQELPTAARTPPAMRLHFEVPEADATKRLTDLAKYD